MNVGLLGLVLAFEVLQNICIGLLPTSPFTPALDLVTTKSTLSTTLLPLAGDIKSTLHMAESEVNDVHLIVCVLWV